MKTILLAVIAACCPSQEQVFNWEEVLQVIKQVETGSESGIGVKGDKGKSYGPFQIHKEYWQDSRVGGNWEQCLDDRAFSELVVLQYMKRYANAEYIKLGKGEGTIKDVEVVCRIHNSGPNGYNKLCSLKYWIKCEKYLKEIHN